MSQNITQPSIITLMRAADFEQISLVTTTRTFSICMNHNSAIAFGLEAAISRAVDAGECDGNTLQQMHAGAQLLAERLRQQARDMEELTGTLAALQSKARSHE
ncbi:hypothetical protein F0A16_20545 [Salinicola corii]|uniref:Uncharacterized protein n=1 Tax=Salinicola corii TaxID=2606937 RepID=A0A640W6K5_9GAMM|nr:hypothetical protein [Salinicola corii]KAA0015480.1 hypothetical protein F0A16_20545 [Salinicola corii]